MINPFFKNIGPININEILRNVGVNNNLKKLVTSIADVKDLANATNKDITFFHSKKYESAASITKASYCITTKHLSNILPKNCEAIEVNNVLVSTSIITKMFYPDSVTDDFDDKTLNIEKTSFEKSVMHGQNILIGKNVKTSTLFTSIASQFLGKIFDRCFVVMQ